MVYTNSEETIVSSERHPLIFVFAMMVVEVFVLMVSSLTLGYIMLSLLCPLALKSPKLPQKFINTARQTPEYLKRIGNMTFGGNDEIVIAENTFPSMKYIHRIAFAEDYPFIEHPLPDLYGLPLLQISDEATLAPLLLDMRPPWPDAELAWPTSDQPVDSLFSQVFADGQTRVSLGLAIRLNTYLRELRRATVIYNRAYWLLPFVFFVFFLPIWFILNSVKRRSPILPSLAELGILKSLDIYVGAAISLCIIGFVMYVAWALHIEGRLWYDQGYFLVGIFAIFLSIYGGRIPSSDKLQGIFTVKAEKIAAQFLIFLCTIELFAFFSILALVLFSEYVILMAALMLSPFLLALFVVLVLSWKKSKYLNCIRVTGYPDIHDRIGIVSISKQIVVYATIFGIVGFLALSIPGSSSPTRYLMTELTSMQPHEVERLREEAINLVEKLKMNKQVTEKNASVWRETLEKGFRYDARFFQQRSR